MTPHMADDEALRVLAKEIRRCAGNNNAKYHLTWADRIDAAVAALQAERDALERNLVAAMAQVAEADEETERAESALEALRGHVAGLVKLASRHEGHDPQLRALLDSDAFRAMVRDAGRWQHYAAIAPQEES